MTIFAYLPLATAESASLQASRSPSPRYEHTYPLPEGLYAVPLAQLDLREDAVIDHELTTSSAISDEKNIFFFWTSGYENMPPYMKRNVRGWHRRFSKQGWKIRVLNRQPESPLNVENYLDVNDPGLFPRSFRECTIDGVYASQHTSDLVRWPLLLRYGGVCADVTLIQIGDLNRLWEKTVGHSQSPHGVISYRTGNLDGCNCNLTKYFIGAKRKNPFLLRCHKLLLELWAAGGGKTNTEGMRASPLLKGISQMIGTYTVEDDTSIIGPEDFAQVLTDYNIPSQVATMVMGTIDEDDNWNGPEYTRQHYYGIDIINGSQFMDRYTQWNGQKAFDLMSLELPKEGEIETREQKEAREMIEGCLQNSWSVRVAGDHDVEIFGQTLGSLWMSHEGTDDVPGTYAHWFRYATIYWNQHGDPISADYPIEQPFKRGPLLREM